jgi:hypothetical protein
MDRTSAARTRAGDDQRSRFDQFVQISYLRVSQAPFFFLCAGIVLVWLVTVPLWTDLKAWQTELAAATDKLREAVGLEVRH